MTKQSTWDLIVIGYGCAGATAAIVGHDAGARVLLLEKAPSGGGTTVVSGGNIRAINDVDEVIALFSEIADQDTPRSVVEAVVRNSVDIPQWLESIGAKLDVRSIPHDADVANDAGKSAYERVDATPALGARMQVIYKGKTGGERLFGLLSENVDKRAIDVEYNVKVDHLVKDDTGRIVGVAAVDRGGVQRTLSARAGVVLACGGYNWSPERHRDLFGTELYPLTEPHRNTGDGIRLAQEVGAALWHMNGVAARYGYKFPEYEAAFKSTMPADGYFMVDQLGRRYLDETGVMIHSAGLAMLVRDPRSGRLMRNPSYIVFDEATRLAGPIGPQANGWNAFYDWSADNSVEVARAWIMKASTIAQLAEQIGVPSKALVETTEAYNRAGAHGGDEFGRDQQRMIPLATAPYYAVETWPTLLNTQGGPRRDEHAQIVDVRGRPIPGLYGAGELGSMWGAIYPGAGNISEGIESAREGVRHALETAPR